MTFALGVVAAQSTVSDIVFGDLPVRVELEWGKIIVPDDT